MKNDDFDGDLSAVIKDNLEGITETFYDLGSISHGFGIVEFGVDRSLGSPKVTVAFEGARVHHGKDNPDAEVTMLSRLVANIEDRFDAEVYRSFVEQEKDSYIYTVNFELKQKTEEN